MVNDRVIDGVNLGGKHPLAGDGTVGVYIRGTPMMCVRAGVGGRMGTVRGVKTFQPGDYICTDPQMGSAWVVRAEEFRVNNYSLVGTIPGVAGDPIDFPSANLIDSLQERLAADEQYHRAMKMTPESIPGVASAESLGLEGARPLTTTADHDGGGTLTPALAAVPTMPQNRPAPDPSPAAASNQGPNPSEPQRAKQTSAPSQRSKPSTSSSR